jgi:uncharacterized protein (TIGR03435 family)
LGLRKASIREIQEAFPEPRPAYTTIQTTVSTILSRTVANKTGLDGIYDISLQWAPEETSALPGPEAPVAQSAPAVAPGAVHFHLSAGTPRATTRVAKRPG